MLCFSNSYKEKCERLVYRMKLILTEPYSVTMDLSFTIKLIQSMDIIGLHWRRLTNLHWLLVDIIQRLTRLKSLIFQATHG